MTAKAILLVEDSTADVYLIQRATEEKEEASCLQLGATAFVQKSSNFYVFFNSIKALVGRWLRSEGGRN